MAGWIYVMTNPSMPGLIKIGMSSQDPKMHRVKELSHSTGVPSAFVVEYQALVEDEGLVENQLHKFYASQRLKGKEFFSGVAVSQVAITVRKKFKILHEEAYFQSAEELQPSSSDALQRKTPTAGQSTRHKANANLLLNPEVKSWYRATRKKSEGIVQRIYREKIKSGISAYEMAVKIKERGLTRADCENPEDYYLYLLEKRSANVVAFQWHFRHQSLDQRLIELLRTTDRP
jgi:hypothetical protein